MKIYLVTHVHTEQLPAAAADTWQLSVRGREEAERLAAHEFWQAVDRVIVSSEPKSWLSVAQLATARQLPVWIDSRFDELRRTGWIEDYAAHVAAAFAKPDSEVGGWESVASVQRRALAALHDLPKRFLGETLAVVGHGLCLSVLRASILGHARVDFDAWQRLPFAAHAVISIAPQALLEDFFFVEQRTR